MSALCAIKLDTILLNKIQHLDGRKTDSNESAKTHVIYHGQHFSLR